MMTQALLAVYPDVFKAGAEFSGVPAGCWADGYASSNQWSGNCAAGKTTFTAAQWGDKIRDMYPGYSGFRPRIQLWHGDSDEIINANNFTEAIKAWTNILGLDSTATSSTTVTLSGKSWTRQSWKSACGFTVLDAWLEKGGAHNIDANLNAQYIIPFFGLDKADDVDPQVVMCSGDAGVVSTGGTGGSITGKDAGAGRDIGSGSASDTGGGADGPMAQGGSISSGGSQSSGGALGSGGNPNGGSIGGSGTGGIAASGGAIRNGGSVSVSGTGGATSSGGSLGTGGSSVKNSGSSSSGCALGDGTHRSQLGTTMALVALALASCVWRRRQRMR
jgi:hypothetical protein